jgi:hypothetical protein
MGWRRLSGSFSPLPTQRSAARLVLLAKTLLQVLFSRKLLMELLDRGHWPTTARNVALAAHRAGPLVRTVSFGPPPPDRLLLPQLNHPRKAQRLTSGNFKPFRQ